MDMTGISGDAWWCFFCECYVGSLIEHSKTKKHKKKKIRKIIDDCTFEESAGVFVIQVELEDLVKRLYKSLSNMGNL